MVQLQGIEGEQRGAVKERVSEESMISSQLLLPLNQSHTSTGHKFSLLIGAIAQNFPRDTFGRLENEGFRTEDICRVWESAVAGLKRR